MKVRGYQKQGKYGKLIAVFCGKLIAKIYGKVLAVYKESFFNEIGVNIVWIDDYNEIPLLLKKIKGENE